MPTATFETSATFFFITDNRASDRTAPPQAVVDASASWETPWAFGALTSPVRARRVRRTRTVKR